MSIIVRSMLLAGTLLVIISCGRKGALIYPDMLVSAAPSQIDARQSGSVVKLQFTLPDKDRGGRPLKSLAGIKISKLTKDATEKKVCRLCTKDYRPFRTLYLDALPADTERIGSRLIVPDTDVNEGNLYSYRVVPFDKNDIDGVSSVIADVGIFASIPAPTVVIESTPTELKLQVSSPPEGAWQLLGFNLYRSSAKSPRSYLPINKPLKGNEFIDTTVERGLKYRYSVRYLMRFGSGDIVESIASEEVEGMLKDYE